MEAFIFFTLNKYDIRNGSTSVTSRTITHPISLLIEEDKASGCFAPVRVNALDFLQCSDTVVWVTRKDT